MAVLVSYDSEEENYFAALYQPLFSMNYQEFLKSLHAGTFLGRFELAQLQWLQLVQTNVIEDWLREMKLDDPHRFNALKFVVWPLLLQRHLLHLETRVNSAKLESFWHWVCSSRERENQLDGAKGLWKNAKIGDVTHHSKPVEQEIAFCQALSRVADELKSWPTLRWALDVVTELAVDRDITKAVKPSVNVVFALKLHTTFSSLRSGLVVRFRLLAPSPETAQVLIAKDIFAESFLSVFDDIRARIDRDLRFMEHDVGLEDKAVLEGKSGTFAFLMAQWLAARPVFNDQFGTLPPWVVISGELNNQTDETSPVGGLAEKANLLTEHGVRYFIVASDPREERASKATLHRIELKGHRLLECLRFQGTKEDLGNELQARILIRKADVSQLQGKQLASIAPEDAERLEKLKQFRFIEFKLEDDFIPPAYAHRILQQAIQRLPQRGYIHLIGEGGIGKTTLVESMRPGFSEEVRSSTPSPVGATIGHIVFRGTAENPTKFVEQILSDAQEHARSLKDKVKKAAFKTELDNLHNKIIGSQSPRPIQQSVAEVVHCVKKHLSSVATVILAIDGLDELTLRDSAELTMRIFELLPAPEQLNPGCYVLLTSRPELRPQVQDAIKQRKIDPSLFLPCELDLNDPGYQSIVDQYIQNKLGPEAAPHIPAILIKAERRFIWVRLLVELLRLSRTKFEEYEAGKLPLPDVGQMLPEYIRQLTHRVREIDNELVAWIKPTLLVIAAAYEPITHRHLQAWLADLAHTWNPDAQYRLDAVLISFQTLLHEDRVSYSNGTAYSIAHREIRDWLEANVEPGWRGALQSEGHQRIINVAVRMGISEKVESKESLDHYHLLFLTSHFLSTGDVKSGLSHFYDSSRVAALDYWTNLCYDRLDFTELIRTKTCIINSNEKLINNLGGEAFIVAFQPHLASYLVQSFANRGVAHADKQDFVHAVKDYERATGLLERIISRMGGEEIVIAQQPELANELASVSSNLGAARERQQDFAQAVKDCDRAIQLREKLLASSGGEEFVVMRQPQLAIDLACAFMSRSNARESQQDFAGAVKDCDQAIGLLEKLISSLGGEDVVVAKQPELANNLKKALVIRGNARLSQQDYAQAVKDFNRAMGLIEKCIYSLGGEDIVIAQQPKLAIDLTQVFMNRGIVYSCQGNFAQALNDYDDAIGLREKLLVSLGGEEIVIAKQPQLANDQAGTFMNRGLAQQGKQDFTQAVKDYDRAIGLLEKLISSSGGEEVVIAQQPTLANQIASAFQNRGNVRRHQMDFAQAMKDYNRAIGLRERILVSLGGGEVVIVEQPQQANDLARLFINRGIARLGQQDLALAMKDYDCAIGLLEKLLPFQLQHALGELLGCYNILYMHSVQSSDDKSFAIAIAKKAVKAVLWVFDAVGESMCIRTVFERCQWLLKLCDHATNRALFVASVHQAKWDQVVRLLRNREEV